MSASKTQSRWWWLGLFVGATGFWSLQAASGTNWQHDFSKAEQESQRLNRPLLLHFHASWCGPCRTMEAEVLNTPEVQQLLADRVIGVKIDFDQHENIAARFGVDKLPSDVIVSPQGKVLFRNEGYQARNAYVANVSHVERKYADSRKAMKANIAANMAQPTEKPVAATPPAVPGAGHSLAKIVGLDGYCPVTLWRTRQWVKGNEKYHGEFQGVGFYFASAEDQADFMKAPDQYVPKLLGCDPVLLWETERALTGSPRFAAYFDGELFLFTSGESRAKFRSSPPQFTKTRHVKLEDIQHEDTRLGMKD